MADRLSDIGEFGWIARLRERIPASGRVTVGPGDDAAALSLRPDRLVLATTDGMVEGVHFRLDISSPEDVGCKAMTSNVSDIAAMGGIPRFALVVAGAAPETALAVLDGLLEGLRVTGEAFDVHLVGGDTVASERLTITVTLIGEEGDHGIVRRSGARAGDAVCVTGALGAAAAGLALLTSADQAARDLLQRFPGLALAHRRGRARLREGQAAAAGGATAMLDVSDGLLSDLVRLCEASGVGVDIREGNLPVAEGVAEAATLLGGDPREIALAGGEDYELLLTIPPVQVEALARAMRPTPLTPIGEVVLAGRTLITAAGERTDLPPGGWDHFRSGGGGAPR